MTVSIAWPWRWLGARVRREQAPAALPAERELGWQPGDYVHVSARLSDPAQGRNGVVVEVIELKHRVLARVLLDGSNYAAVVDVSYLELISRASE